MPNQFPEIYIQYLGIILVTILLIGFIITILLLYQKKQLLQEKELLAVKSAFEIELMQTKIEIQENVLTNVSMEIHDNIGQIMLLANVNMSILQRLQLPPDAPGLIRETKQMLSQASEDISQLSRSLNADRITQLGVFKSILIELDILQQKGVFTVELTDEVGISGVELTKDVQLLVFRMFQEILNNIIKHAKATHLSVAIKQLPDGYAFNIRDNGVGFAFPSPAGGPPASDGLGLRSLAERARLFGGAVDIKSVLQQGTSIHIFIPLSKLPVNETIQKNILSHRR